MRGTAVVIVVADRLRSCVFESDHRPPAPEGSPAHAVAGCIDRAAEIAACVAGIGAWPTS